MDPQYAFGLNIHLKYRLPKKTEKNSMDDKFVLSHQQNFITSKMLNYMTSHKPY
jgi:hypothetical protein